MDLHTALKRETERETERENERQTDKVQSSPGTDPTSLQVSPSNTHTPTHTPTHTSAQQDCHIMGETGLAWTDFSTSGENGINSLTQLQERVGDIAVYDQRDSYIKVIIIDMYQHYQYCSINALLHSSLTQY